MTTAAAATTRKRAPGVCSEELGITALGVEFVRICTEW